MTNRAQQVKGREALHRALPSARFYDVGGRQLMLYASGAGGPVVVFLPGAKARKWCSWGSRFVIRRALSKSFRAAA